MNFQEYQERTNLTAREEIRDSLEYAVLGLAGEAGEVADKTKKLIRDLGGTPSIEWKNAVAKELGDVLWYVQRVSMLIGYDLETIAKMNIYKLEDRMRRGTLQGSGDDR